MTEHEFDDLVQRIGDEILARLGHEADLPPPGAGSSCGCGDDGEQSLLGARKPSMQPDAAGTGSSWSPPNKSVARLIDHTLLRPEATEGEIVRLCAEAKEYGFWSVCVHPCWVGRAVRELQGTKRRVTAVIGFPHGATATPVKCAEAEQVLKLGASELDVVINIGALRSGDLDFVYDDLRPVVQLAQQCGALVKAILEMGLLSKADKMKGCVVARLAGADFVKTSTAFGPSGADPRDVELLHRLVGGEMGIKAAGGIRSFEAMREMMAAGATRIGTSSSIAILKEAGAASAAGAAAPTPEIPSAPVPGFRLGRPA